MNKKGAVFGYVFGVVVGLLGGWCALFGMLVGSWDSLMDALILSPAVILVGFADSEAGLLAAGVQAFAFWGVVGALAPQGRHPAARRVFILLLVIHWVVAIAFALTSGMSFSPNPVLLPSYLGFMTCLIGAAAVTWRKYPAQEGTPFESGKAVSASGARNAARSRGQWVIAGLAVLGMAGLGSASGYHRYREFMPYRLHSLDLGSGKVTTVRAADSNFLCGIDEATRTLTVFRRSDEDLTLRKVSFDGVVKDEFRASGPANLSNSHFAPQEPYSVDTGKFAWKDHGTIDGAIGIYTPGQGTDSISLPQDEILSLYWRSKDSLVALTVDYGNKMDNFVSPEFFRSGAIRLVDTVAKTSVVVLEGFSCPGYGNALSPDGSLFAFSHLKGNQIVLELLNLDTGERRVVKSIAADSCISEVDWSPDGQRLAWTYADPYVDWEPQQRPHVVEWADLPTLTVRTVSGSPMDCFGESDITFCGSGKLALLRYADHAVAVADLQSGELRAYPIPSSVEFQAVYCFDNAQKLLLAR